MLWLQQLQGAAEAEGPRQEPTAMTFQPVITMAPNVEPVSIQLF